MSADRTRIIVIDTACQAWDVQAVHVCHEQFPELRIEGASAEQAAARLADRMKAALDNADPWHRVEVETAIADIQAFLDRKTPVHVA